MDKENRVAHSTAWDDHTGGQSEHMRSRRVAKSRKGVARHRGGAGPGMHTLRQVFHPIFVGSSSVKLPGSWQFQVGLPQGWLVDGFIDRIHTQVSVVMTEQVPASA